VLEAPLVVQLLVLGEDLLQEVLQCSGKKKSVL
jgi:hypothetical protein